MLMSASHVGPCTFYMAPLESAGDGPVWIKIYEKGWDKDKKKWCNNEIIDNDGKFDVTIPKNIPDGDYLIRTEMIALHQANKVGGAQLYPNCVVITVTGGTGSTFPSGSEIPGIYQPKDPGILYDRGDDPTTYKIPGPNVFEANGSSSNTTSSTSAKVTTTKQITTPNDKSSTPSNEESKQPSGASACVKRRNLRYRRSRRSERNVV
ncbi:hypothetical protein H4R22_004447 [Coemansia sp. RSA 1290]|nr:hypothetical protein H4R22_004447 [Coemansia sp. RSA 1290]